MGKNNKTLLNLILFWTVVVTLGMVCLTQFSQKAVLSNRIAYLEKELIKAKENSEKNDEKDNVIVEYITISQIGKLQIKEFEGLSLTSYNDGGKGRKSIGYGHQIKTTDPQWLRDKYSGGFITPRQADRIFEKDITEFVEPALNRLKNEIADCGVNTSKLSQGFYDALGSLIYNCGEGGVRQTEFFRQLKRGRVKTAIALVPTTRITANGHKERRRKEASMMLDS